MLPHWHCTFITYVMHLAGLTLNTDSSQHLDARTDRATNTVTKDTPAPGEHVHATHLLAQWISGPTPTFVSPNAIEWARHVLLDWLAVTIAGSTEPLVQMLLDEYVGDNELPCVLVACGLRARPHDAALINGSAGHALDYDDVASRMSGHPSVPVVPAALAIAEIGRVTGLELLRAIVIGHEVESRIGEMVAPSHYLHGFHATGTIGTFGAAAACASLRRLDAGQTAHALGLAATQAAGLKSMFGTMAKPLHAGKAAMNGLIAAQLAARGFTANEEAIEGVQGFAATQATELKALVSPLGMTGGFAIESTLFKYHAACYLTHSAVEAIRRLRELHDIDLDAMASMHITVAVNHRGVCDVAEPDTGLAVKFSIQHMAALALDGIDTSDLALYSDATARDARHAEARRRVSLTFTTSPDHHTALVSLVTRDGRTLEQSANVAVPATDLDAQWARLMTKARAIAEPVIGPERFDRMVAAVQALDTATSLELLLEAIQ